MSFLRFGATALARAAELVKGRAPSALPTLVPPLEFPCRIEKLPEGCADIDNELYGEAEHAATWHGTDPSSTLATLRLLNAARIPYFDRVWRQQLRLGPDRPGAFLEVGCGGGIATGALAELGYGMTGVEPAAASLDEARAHAERLGLPEERLRFTQGDAYDLSMFGEASFDGVVMADVLEHLYDLPAAIAQVRRVLRPGGVLVFDTINRTYASYVLAIALAQEGLGMVPPRTHDWRMFVQPHELSFLLQAHGFTADTAQFRGMAPSFAPSPLGAIAAARRAIAERAPPALPLSDFVEIGSLEVNYLGFALRRDQRTSERDEARDQAGGAPGVSGHAPGELARGLSEARRGGL
jgi:2-polyprenyl-6-hydroxyphenyl methylase/3-demethylubiquinone-9 3-methyltransferase